MTRPISVRFVSRLAAPAVDVWAHATSPSGINRELAPLMKMTFPQSVETLSEDTVAPGQPICRSWFLLFGFLPVDRAEVTLAALGPGRRFVEESPLNTMKLWRHTRSVTEAAGGCGLEDELAFEPRWPVSQPLARWIIERIFTHRHARLRRIFGEL